jgi:hypothetical protein
VDSANVECLSAKGHWRACTIVGRRADPGPSVLVHYEGYKAKHDEWVNLQTDAGRVRAVDLARRDVDVPPR